MSGELNVYGSIQMYQQSNTTQCEREGNN